MARIRQANFIPRYDFQGKPTYHLDRNGNQNAEPYEPILVKKNGDVFEIVREFPAEGVDRFEIDANYGYWVDAEKAHMEGMIWDRHRVVERPLDGSVDNDEVSEAWKSWRTPLPPDPYGDFYSLGSEIVMGANGEPTLHQHYQPYLKDKPESYDGKILREYRADISNWLVVTAN